MSQPPILERVPVGPLGTNAYVLGCAETHEGVIIDPGDEGRRLVLLAQTLGLQIGKVLITHGHVDHVLLYESCVMQAQLFGIKASDPPPIDGELADGQLLAIGKLEARVIGTPGHSEGGVSFYLAAPGLLFSGDTLFQGGIGRTDLPGGSMKQLMSSIRDKLLTLPGDTRVFSGHGAPTTVQIEQRSNPFVR
jgi:hydroxyacylglutathione hydrolase